MRSTIPAVEYTAAMNPEDADAPPPQRSLLKKAQLFAYRRMLGMLARRRWRDGSGGDPAKIRPGARIPFIVDVAHAVKIPIIAIGGVEPQHVEVLKAAGAYGIATIRGVGWDKQAPRHDTDPTPGKTRLVGAHGAPAGEMITRYISAYDWSSGSSRKDHSDGERLDPGDSAK